MKKASITLGIVVMVLCASVQAQTCPKMAGCMNASVDDEALEQLMLLQFAKECALDDYDLVEMLQGHAEFRAAMESLDEQRADAKADLEKAIDGGGSNVAAKMNVLMRVDQQILSAKQDAVSEAGSLLNARDQAALYLMVSELDQRKKQLGAALSGPCHMRGAGMAGAAAAAAPAIDPAEALLANIKEFTEKLAEGDIDSVIKTFSDDFSHYEFGDKEGVRNFLKDAADMGYLDDLEVDLDDTEIEIVDDEGTAYPIDISGAFGSATLELEGKLKDGVWVLTGLDISGI